MCREQKRLNNALTLIGFSIGSISGIMMQEGLDKELKIKLYNILDILSNGADDLLKD